MKTTSIRTIGLALSAMIFSHQPFAQNLDSKNALAGEVSYNSIKRILPSGNESSVIDLPANMPYNGKVITRFRKEFFNATNIQWSFSPNGSYHAFFTKDGAPNAILFNKKGGIIYLIKYLSENQLPVDVKKMITDGYSEYQITHVAEVIQDNTTIWVVNLASLNHIVAIREAEGVMEEIFKYKKAK